MGIVGCDRCKKSDKDQTQYFDHTNTIEENKKGINEKNQLYSELKERFEELFNTKINELGNFISKEEFENLITKEQKEYINQIPFDKNKIKNNEQYRFEMKPVEFPNGNIYEGEWNEYLEMDGYGNYILKNDNVLVQGIWEKGILKYGRIFLPNGDIYEGEFENNLFDGDGKYYSKSDETIFEGKFNKGEKEDYGKIIYNDGSIYEGNLINDLPNGNGIFNWVEQNNLNTNNYSTTNNYNFTTPNTITNNNFKYIYEGEFVNGQLNGFGKLKNEETGSEYEGDFKNNLFHGKGCYKWGTNNLIKYEGDYQFGEKNGNGIYTKSNFKYSGNFSEGKPHGLGLVEKNGKLYKCSWRNGLTVENPILQNGQRNIFENVDINFIPEKEEVDFNQLKHLNYEKKNNFNFTIGKSFMDLLN